MNLTDKIFEAGVLGCGGAGFPTHVKLKAAPEILIINGAECEPLLRTDRYLMQHKADRLVAGIDLICREQSIPEACIALKKTYTAEIQALTDAIKRAGSGVRLHLMDSFYPAGDEQVVVYEVTGKVVPPAGIPLDVGAIVDNVATVIAVADAAEGIPFTDKYLTVTGEVARPSVLKVPVGTSFEKCIEMAGGVTKKKVMVVSGGPMMGVSMSWEAAMSASVTKTTSGILVLPEDGDYDRQRKKDLRRMLNRAKSACIQCTFCTQLCPRHMLGHPLQPHRIMRKMAMCADTGQLLGDQNAARADSQNPKGDTYAVGLEQLLEDKDIRQAAICSECGVCEVYACPMGLQPRMVNALLKGELTKAGIRYDRSRDAVCRSSVKSGYSGSGMKNGNREDITKVGVDIYTPDENRPYRKVPTHRMAVRAGVGDYYHINNHEFVEGSADRVTLPLKMNIGVPARPVIADGTCVRKGQLIAACPEGKLGVNLHASISGVAHVTDQSITIIKEQADV